MFVSFLLLFVETEKTSSCWVHRKCKSNSNFELKDQNKELPTEFDLRDINGFNYLSPLKNQNIPTFCDSSWAIAATSVIADRFRLQTHGSWPLRELSAQVLINCDDMNYGCSGGSSLYAYKYIYENGIPDESCLPLSGTQEQCRDVNICRICKENGLCYPVSNYTKYYISDYGPVSGEEKMKEEIYKHGTISCKIHINKAFYNYEDGIFSEIGESVNEIFVTVIGWGNLKNVPYWIIRNNWGSYWGEHGYARILRGFNLLGIESECSWATPDLNRLFRNKTHVKSNMTNYSYYSNIHPTDWKRIKPVIKTPIPSSYVNMSRLPKQYDIRYLNEHNYATINKNERSPTFCHASWAQATTSALSDRLNLYNRGKLVPFMASDQVLLNCVGNGCGGGDPGEVYQYIYNEGIPDTTCQVYEGKQKDCNHLGICMDCNSEGECWNVLYYNRLFVSEFGEVSGVQNMKAEIYERGPITCFIVLTTEFLDYSGGIFIEHDHNYKGGHIVEVTGWGRTIKGEHYWIIRNNWGEGWGENGWARIKMGSQNLMIESSCSWGVPYL